MDATPLFNYIERYVALTDHDKSTLLEHIGFRKYLKGQYIIQQGDICRYENFVLSGCLRTFYVDGKGEEHIVMFAVENWWTADLGSFITQTPADYNVQCLETTEVIQFSSKVMEKLYTEIPALERFFRIITQTAYVAAQKRIIHNNSLSAKERYLRFRKNYPQIEQRVPQYMIASYLGITKEFLSKIRNQLIVDDE